MATKKKKKISNKEFDEKFESGGDLSEHVDYSAFTKRIPFDLPVWAVKIIDREATRRGMTRQSLIKYWVTEKADELSALKKVGA
jgi:hypothetical protein